QSRIDQTEHAELRPIIWLRLHDLLLFEKRLAKGGLCPRLIFHHPRQQSFPKTAAQTNRAVAPPRIVTQRYQGPLSCLWIAFCQGANKPVTGGIRNCS